jgi:hypothetical protein
MLATVTSTCFTVYFATSSVYTQVPLSFAPSLTLHTLWRFNNHWTQVQRLGGRTVVRNSAELKAQLFALLGTSSSSNSQRTSSSGSAGATRGAIGAGRTEQFTVPAAQQQQQQQQRAAVPVSRFGSSRRQRQEAKLQQLEQEQQQLQQQFAA